MLLSFVVAEDIRRRDRASAPLPTCSARSGAAERHDRRVHDANVKSYSFRLCHGCCGPMRLPAASSRFEGPGADAIKQVDDVLETVAGNALGDEYNPCSMIAVRPTVEPGHRMQEMLRALDHRRSAGFLSDVHESFDAQKPGPRFCAIPSSRNCASSRIRGVSRVRTKFSIPLPSRW